MQQRYKIFLYLTLLLVVCIVALVGRLPILKEGLPGSPTQQMSIGGAFELVDQNNTPVTEKTYAGRYMLVFFGYTYCPDVCPTDLAIMARALDIIGPERAAKVAPIFISVDPERDTPEVLGAYVKSFHPDLIGLTGTPDQVKQAASAFKVYFAKAITGTDPKDDYLVDHSAFTYLLGPDGKAITFFNHGTSATEMAEKLGKIL